MSSEQFDEILLTLHDDEIVGRGSFDIPTGVSPAAFGIAVVTAKALELFPDSLHFVQVVHEDDCECEAHEHEGCSCKNPMVICLALHKSGIAKSTVQLPLDDDDYDKLVYVANITEAGEGN